MSILRFNAFFGLQCLGYAALSAIFHTGYAIHEICMGLGVLTTVAVFAGAVALWRFVHPVAA